MQIVYFDHNATTPILPKIQEKYPEWLAMVGNANSIHSHGQHSRGLLENARDELCAIFHANHCIFTATASEALNLAPKLWDSPAITSMGDHACIINNPAVKPIIPLTATGLVDLDFLENYCTQNPRPLFLMHLAHNESGIIQPFAQIAQIIHQHGGILVGDAVQYAGKYSMNMAQIGLDGLVISGHKMGAGFGAAGLLLMEKPAVNPLIYGGGQEYGYRAGTENTPAILAMVMAQQLSLEYDWTAHQPWHKQLEQLCQENGCQIIGHDRARLPNTSLIIHPSQRGVDMVIKADLLNLCLSSGSACSSGTSKPSASLLAMGIAPTLAQNSLRISSGLGQNGSDFQKCCEILTKILK